MQAIFHEVPQRKLGCLAQRREDPRKARAMCSDSQRHLPRMGSVSWSRATIKTYERK